MVPSDDVQIRLRMLGAALFERDAKKAARSLQDVGRGAGVAARGVKGVEAPASRSARAIGAVGRGAVSAGHGLDRMSRAAGRAGVAAGALAVVGFGAVARETVGFDEKMRNVNSIAQLSEERFRALAKSVRGLAGPTAQSPQTLAAGLYDLVSSGFNAQQSMTILESSARAATAGLSTTEVATGAVAAVLNAYERPARDAANVSDVLFQTVNRGVISFSELAGSIGEVLPFANGLGVDLNQVGAAISTLTKKGLSGDVAVTDLKNAMQAFIKPSEGMQAAVKKTGASSAEALIRARGFQGALLALIGTTNGSKTAVGRLFPNIRGLTAALDLTGSNARAAAGDLGAFKDVTGATSTALAQQSKSVAFQWRRLKAEASSLAIGIGGTLVPATLRAVDAFAHLASSRGAVGQFAAGLRGHDVRPRVTRAQHRFDGPAVPRPVPGAQVVGAKVRQVLDRVGKGAVALAKRAVPALRDAFSQVLDAIKPATPFLQNVLLPLLKGVAIGVIGGVVAAFKIAVPVIKILAIAFGAVGKVLRPFRGVIQGVGIVIGFVFGGPLLKAISGLGKLGKVFRLLRVPIEVANGAVRGAARVIGGVVRGFARAHLAVLRFVGSFAGGAARVARGALNMVGGIIEAFVRLPGRLVKLAGTIVSKFTGALGSAASAFFRAGWAMGKSIITGVVNAIEAAPGAILGAVLSIIPDKLKGAVKKMFHAAGLASGGTVNRGGWAVVGERGPELAHLGSGSTVYSARESAKMPDYLRGAKSTTVRVAGGPGARGMPRTLHVTLVAAEGGKALAHGVATFEDMSESLR